MKQTVILKYLLTQCIMKKYSHLHLSVSKGRTTYLRHASVSGHKKQVIGNTECILSYSTLRGPLHYAGKFHFI